MTRILLVDDEPLILKGLSRRLQREPGVEVLTAMCVDEAVQTLEREPVDVLLTDIQMPGRSGTELLAEAVERWPRVVRVVMSAHLDRRSWAPMLPDAQAVLHKPAGAAAVRSTLRQAALLQDSFQDPAVVPALEAIEGLPPAPAMYRKLGELAHDLSAGLADVARVVEADPAIAAQVLRVANSAWLGLPRQVSSLQDALNFLGIDMVRRLTLTAEVFVSLGARATAAGEDLTRVQRSAAVAAHLAANIAPKGHQAAASTAGLLHQIGVLALASAQPARWRSVRARVAEGQDALEAQQAEFGCTHATAGAFLLHRWGLPLELVAAVAFQDAPQRTGATSLDVPGAVHLAARLTHGALEGELWAPQSAAATVDLAWLEQRGCAEELPRWRKLAESLVRADD